jgi:hypothetical protein
MLSQKPFGVVHVQVTAVASDTESALVRVRVQQVPLGITAETPNAIESDESAVFSVEVRALDVRSCDSTALRIGGDIRREIKVSIHRLKFAFRRGDGGIGSFSRFSMV